MEEMQENKRFMVRQWEEIRKAGGISFSIEQMNAILQESEVKMLDREELIARVVGYFNSCVKVAIDEDTGEKVTTWCRNPTKSGLALVLGIDKQTLLDYVKGVQKSNADAATGKTLLMSIIGIKKLAGTKHRGAPIEFCIIVCKKKLLVKIKT